MKTCRRDSPHYPNHHYTSRSRTLRNGEWTDWEYSCCWCGKAKPA